MNTALPDCPRRKSLSVSLIFPAVAPPQRHSHHSDDFEIFSKNFSFKKTPHTHSARFLVVCEYGTRGDAQRRKMTSLLMRLYAVSLASMRARQRALGVRECCAHTQQWRSPPRHAALRVVARVRARAAPRVVTARRARVTVSSGVRAASLIDRRRSVWCALRCAARAHGRVPSRKCFVVAARRWRAHCRR